MDSTLYLIDYNRPPTMMYRMNITTLELFLKDLMNGTITDYAITEETGAFSLKSSLFQSDSDYVINMTFYPINLDDVMTTGSTSTDVYLGKKKLTSYTVKDIVSVKPYVEIAEFTISRPHNNFLDFSPYTRIWLHIPFFSPIEIPTDVAYDTTGFTINFAIDLFSNHATVYIERKTGNKIIASASAKIGIEVPWGKTNAEEIQRNNALQMITALGGVISTGVGVYTGNPIALAGGVSMVTKNITQALSNNVQHLNTYNGGDGNRDGLCINKDIYLHIETPKDVKYPNRSLRGGVCKDNYTLSSLSGYTQVGNINFNPSGYEIYNDEISEIVELLKSGVIL